jgi:hypothetical protein
MFLMTSSIKIGDFKPVKPNTLKWVRKVDNYIDTASVKLPAIAMLKTTGDTYEMVETGLQLKEGMKIEIACGYNSNNKTVFKGFVRRRVFSVPLELECEGYSYQLSTKIGFSTSHQSITVRKLLEELCEGTDIKLSPQIPDVTLQNIRFKNVKGTDVLEYLKDKCLLTVFFDFDFLYVGLRMTKVKGRTNFRLGWNVIKDSDLKFESNKELATVNLKIEKREKTGHKRKGQTDIKDGSIKTLQIRHIYDEAALKAIADQKRSELITKGYEGKINCFLVPYSEPGMAAKITDKRYPEREGLYFIESVEGEFSPSGGRQKIGIGVSLNG